MCFSFRNDFNFQTFTSKHQKVVDSNEAKKEDSDSCCKFDRFQLSLQRNENNADVNISTSKTMQRKRISSDKRGSPVGRANSCNASSLKSSSSDLSPPYMLTLQGNVETLIHSLKSSEILIGNDVTDFKLDAPDILRHHCVIHRDLEVLFSEADNSNVQNHWCVTLTPLRSDATVRINGSRICSKYQMQHGDLVSIGKHHLFMFKDPLHHAAPINGVKQYAPLSNRGSMKESDKSSGQTCNSSSASTSPPQANTTHCNIKTCLNYSLEHEVGVLDLIFTSFHNWGNFPVDLPLSPAILLSHCVIHSCLNFKLDDRNKLIRNACSKLRSIVKVRLTCPTS